MNIDISVKNHVVCKPCDSLPAWHKVDISKLHDYEQYVNNESSALLNRKLNSVDDIDTFCYDLYHILRTAASLYIPLAKFKPYLRPEWTPTVKSLHSKERQMRNIWLSEGRPRGMCHESYKNYKRAKRDFRNELNAEHEIYMASVFQDIDEASECDIRLFWKLVKQQKPKTTKMYTEIESDGNLIDDPISQTVLLAILNEFTIQLTATILTQIFFTV